MKIKFFAIVAMIFMATATVFAQQTVVGPSQQSIERPIIRVGDEWVFRSTDGRTGLVLEEGTLTVVETASDHNTISKSTSSTTFNFTESLDLNTITSGGTSRYYPDTRRLKFPLKAGQTYVVKNEYDTNDGYRGSETLDATVVGWETVTVPAGTFNALKVTLTGRYESHEIIGLKGGIGSMEITFWFAPEAKRSVKQIYKSSYWSFRGLNNFSVSELLRYKVSK